LKSLVYAPDFLGPVDMKQKPIVALKIVAAGERTGSSKPI
jgi:hypothetical protein